MLDVYSCEGGANAIAGSGTDEVVWSFWNPSSTIRVRVLEFHMWRAGTAQSRHVIRRSTTRGTGTQITTPDADNAWHSAKAPASGVTLDGATFSPMPTLATPPLMTFALNTGTGTTGMGFVWANPRGIWVPPGTGLVCVNPTAAAGSATVFVVVWEE